MKKEKILINIENLNELEEYKKIGINNFLFAVDEFSIGYKSFSLDVLEDLNNKYNITLYINRVFDTKTLEDFKLIKNRLLSFKNIIFEDIAVYNVLKDTNINLILNIVHFQTNYSSINYWLDYVSSCVISNELDKDSIKLIMSKSNKKLVFNIFGRNNVMYSRRLLISNFNNNFNLESKDEILIKEKITNNNFIVKESNYGTMFFNEKYFNLIPRINEFDDNKILYYIIFPDSLKPNDINDLLNNKSNISYDYGFLDKKTIYKIGEL